MSVSMSLEIEYFPIDLARSVYVHTVAYAHEDDATSNAHLTSYEGGYVTHE